jgi:hypothetical protein
MDITDFSQLINNKFIRIILALLFFVFLLNIIYQIGIFLGVNKNILDMYFIWVGIVVLFITILPTKRSNI